MRAPHHELRTTRSIAPRRASVGLALAIVALSGCSITGMPERTSRELELTRNRQRWASAAIHDYEFDFQRLCFCTPESTEPVHVVVRGDAIVSVVRVRDGQPASTAYSVWPRVDELFADVQQRIRQPTERLDVTYDPTFGYPRSIVVDIALMTADDEYSLTAGNLRRLP